MFFVLAGTPTVRTPEGEETLAPGDVLYFPEGGDGLLDSAIGFPSRSTSASSMLGLLMPEEVRRSFMRPPGVVTAGENVRRA
jgi:hypothetical protein